MEFVITVNDNDEAIGTMEKMDAHQKGELHRAFSVFVFNSSGKILLHQRAKEKYHSGQLWTNTCCGHPRPNEETLNAAQRRLKEEMGFTCSLEHKFRFMYKAHLDHDMIEHEIDHVYFGFYNENPQPNPNEVMDYKWISTEELSDLIEINPNEFTEWFKICFPLVKELAKSITF